jgi:hypothetical protein
MRKNAMRDPRLIYPIPSLDSCSLYLTRSADQTQSRQDMINWGMLGDRLRMITSGRGKWLLSRDCHDLPSQQIKVDFSSSKMKKN